MVEVLRAKLEDGTESATALNVVVEAGPYATENIQLAPGRESLLDPELIIGIGAWATKRARAALGEDGPKVVKMVGEKLAVAGILRHRTQRRLLMPDGVA